MSNKAKVLKHIPRAVCSRSAFGDHYVIRNKDGYGYFGRGKTPALAWANAASRLLSSTDLIERLESACADFEGCYADHHINAIREAISALSKPVAWKVRWANGEVELTEDAERVEEYRIAKEQSGAQLTITPLAALTTTETKP